MFEFIKIPCRGQIIYNIVQDGKNIGCLYQENDRWEFIPFIPIDNTDPSTIERLLRSI